MIPIDADLLRELLGMVAAQPGQRGQLDYTATPAGERLRVLSVSGIVVRCQFVRDHATAPWTRVQ